MHAYHLNLAIVVLGCACDSQAPTAPSPSATTSPSSSASATTYCADKKGEMTRYGVKWDDALTLPVPAAFPAPPTGAVLCGTTPEQHIAYYHLAGATIPDIVARYRTAIQGLGMNLNEGGVGGVVSFDNRQALGSGRYEGGSVTYAPSLAELKLVYRKE